MKKGPAIPWSVAGPASILAGGQTWDGAISRPGVETAPQLLPVFCMKGHVGPIETTVPRITSHWRKITALYASQATEYEEKPRWVGSYPAPDKHP